MCYWPFFSRAQPVWKSTAVWNCITTVFVGRCAHAQVDHEVTRQIMNIHNVSPYIFFHVTVPHAKWFVYRYMTMFIYLSWKGLWPKQPVVSRGCQRTNRTEVVKGRQSPALSPCTCNSSTHAHSATSPARDRNISRLYTRTHGDLDSLKRYIIVSWGYCDC
jgi:hypothetical protein